MEQQSRELIGNPDPALGTSRRLYYDVLFFLEQGTILQPNTSEGDTAIAIQCDQPLNQVISNLADNGIIPDAALFRKMLIYTGADQRILPGKYLIPAGSTMLDVANLLQDLHSSLIDFSILSGWRIEEIAQALPTSGLSISMDDFLQKVNQPVTDPDLFDPGMISHEGYLMPGLYTLRRDTTVDELIGGFISRFKLSVTKDMRDAYSTQGLSTYQAVILASIIQREAVLDEEKPLIASVFLNRLKNNMQLQTDPTVQYALGFSADYGWWKSPLSFQDLEIISAYNTYMISGLPPAPISNPDITSLKAVAFPEESTYFYFRAACDNSGRHVFSETMEEHSMNGCSESGS